MLREILALGLFLIGVSQVEGHGRLTDPPSRSSMWRYGFDTPPNYTDHELSCGGWGRQHQTNKGKCGICGDAWDLPEPRPNEDGGTYGKGVISRTYKQGDIIEIGVHLTAYHMGYFEFKICPVVPNQKSDQACLDKYPLEMADGSGFRYIPKSGPAKYSLKVKLPGGLTCDRCVVQWHYETGNRWGICEDGKGRNGCGPQETFRGCADVRINP